VIFCDAVTKYLEIVSFTLGEIFARSKSHFFTKYSQKEDIKKKHLNRKSHLRKIASQLVPIPPKSEDFLYMYKSHVLCSCENCVILCDKSIM